jgi:hypothetical protein
VAVSAARASGLFVESPISGAVPANGAAVAKDLHNRVLPQRYDRLTIITEKFEAGRRPIVHIAVGVTLGHEMLV